MLNVSPIASNSKGIQSLDQIRNREERITIFLPITHTNGDNLEKGEILIKLIESLMDVYNTF